MATRRRGANDNTKIARITEMRRPQLANAHFAQKCSKTYVKLVDPRHPISGLFMAFFSTIAIDYQLFTFVLVVVLRPSNMRKYKYNRLRV